jgi:hypothetical protein
LRFKIEDSKARADVEDNFRKTVGQLLGGAAVLIGAWLAYSGTQRSIEASKEAAHDLLISQQVSKGFEDLGSPGPDKLMVRLGGIYALEGVMKGSDDYRQPVLEALCAFVREYTQNAIVPNTAADKIPDIPNANDRPRLDVQSALTVIGRRKPGAGNVDLSRAHLSRADLSGADLSRANLTGADLRSAILSDANLSDTLLLKADLRAAALLRANLSGAILSGAILSGANLSGTDLRSAILSDADLRNADLSGARNVTQAQLDKACGINTMLPPGLTIKPCSR